MSIGLGLALYFMIWFVTLFLVLPFGVRTQAEAGEIVPGTPASAPASPKLLRIALINTALASVVFIILLLVLNSELVNVDLPPPPPQVTR